MTLGDRRKSHRLGNQHVKDISAHRRKRGMGIISEGTLPSFPESKRKGEEKYFQSCKILLMSPYNKDRAGTPGCASCLDYLAGLTWFNKLFLNLSSPPPPSVTPGFKDFPLIYWLVKLLQSCVEGFQVFEVSESGQQLANESWWECLAEVRRLIAINGEKEETGGGIIKPFIKLCKKKKWFL